jgi:hypothetical protein
MSKFQATYSFNVRRHLRIEIEAASHEDAERTAKADGMAYIDAEIVAFQNADGFSDTEPLDPWLCLDECDPDDGSVEVFDGALPDPDAPTGLTPMPIDLILAARDVIAAYGGDVPDWLQNEIGMLELALRPFASFQPPLPLVAAFGEGDEMPIRRLEQREGAETHVLVGAFWNVISEALGLDDIDDAEANRIVDNMFRKHVGGWDDLAALVTVKQGGDVDELWASDRYPDSEGVRFTCIWKRGDLAEPYSFEDVLKQYDEGALNDEQAIAELEKRGWAERRARVILEQHIAG